MIIPITFNIHKVISRLLAMIYTFVFWYFQVECLVFVQKNAFSLKAGSQYSLRLWNQNRLSWPYVRCTEASTISSATTSTITIITVTTFLL